MGEQASSGRWLKIIRPGYLGSRREEMEATWDRRYGGRENWRIVFLAENGLYLTFPTIFHHYVSGYQAYFETHPEEAEFLAENFAYAYDKDLVTREVAFDPQALHQKPGFSNQFHHVALNIALERKLEIPFRGAEPVQVRLGKPGTPTESWPAGWRWHPGRIPCTEPDLIPSRIIFLEQWWEDGSVEDLYQKSKLLEVRASCFPDKT